MADARLPDRRHRYFQALRLPARKPPKAQKAALDRAHDLRRFEIENYWRRATYFWGFQLVAFGAGALTAFRGEVFPPLVLVVAVLGAITSWAAVLTARGSKFWQENWEAHVDLLEDEVEGLLHKTVSARAPRFERSVSRINDRLLQLLLVGWLIVFAAAAAVIIEPRLLDLPSKQAAWLQVYIATATLVLGIAWLSTSPRSNITDRAFSHHSFLRVDPKR